MKRGDENWFVMSLILVLLVLALIMVVLIKFPWSETIDREACRESILVRGLLPGDNAPIKDFANLRCETKNTCITAKLVGAGNCTGIGKDFVTKRVTGNNDQKAQKIKMFMAQEMAECWTMFGRGQIQLFSRDWKWDSGSKVARGVICSKIQFDNTITVGDPDLNNGMRTLEGFKAYLLQYEAPGKNMSYMDYLINNDGQSDSAAILYGDSLHKAEIAESLSNDTIDIEKIQSIFYIETTLSNIGKGIGGAVAAIGAVYLGGGSPLSIKLAGVAAFPGAWLGDVTQKAFFGLPNNQVFAGALILTEYDSAGFKDYNIDSFENI